MILKLYKRVLTLFVAACIVWGGSSAYALSISARGGFVMDADTGEEIYSQNGDTALVPASMTKVMAVYAIYDAMAQGRISKDTVITIGPALSLIHLLDVYKRQPLTKCVFPQPSPPIIARISPVLRLLAVSNPSLRVSSGECVSYFFII